MFPIKMLPYLIFAPLIGTSASGTIAPTMCFSGPVTFGSVGFINCFFNRNINASRESFRILQKPKGKEEIQVAICMWQDDHLNCKLKPGVRYEGSIKDRATFIFNSVGHEQSGDYVCQLTSQENIPTQTCTLEIKDSWTSSEFYKTTADNLQTTFIQKKDILPTRREENFSSNWAHDEGPWQKATIALVVCLGIFVFVFLLITLLVRRHGSMQKFFVAVWFCKGKKPQASDLDNPQGRSEEEAHLCIEPATDSASLTDVSQSSEEEEVNIMDNTDRTKQMPQYHGGGAKNRRHTTFNLRHKKMCNCYCSLQAAVPRNTDLKMTQTQKQITLVETWDVNDIRDWLQEVSLDKYKPLQVVNMTGKKLLTLNHMCELKKMGIEGYDAQWLKDKITDLIKVNQQVTTVKDNEKKISPRVVQR